MPGICSVLSVRVCVCVCVCVCETFGSLKNHITSLFCPRTQSLFGIHDPPGIHYLFQLRVGLSPLRGHKKRHNIHDITSDCQCSFEIENTSHFLFQCPFTLLREQP